MSKLLSNAGIPTATMEEKLTERYEKDLQVFKDGINQQVWENGSVEDKRNFFEAGFRARVDGTKLHEKTGQPHDIPSFGFGEDFEFGIEQSELPQPGGFKETYQAVELKSSGIKSTKPSRYEQALNAFGDIGGTETHDDLSLDH